MDKCKTIIVPRYKGPTKAKPQNEKWCITHAKWNCLTNKQTQ